MSVHIIYYEYECTHHMSITKSTQNSKHTLGPVVQLSLSPPKLHQGQLIPFVQSFHGLVQPLATKQLPF